MQFLALEFSELRSLIVVALVVTSALVCLCTHKHEKSYLVRREYEIACYEDIRDFLGIEQPQGGLEGTTIPGTITLSPLLMAIIHYRP